MSKYLLFYTPTCPNCPPVKNFMKESLIEGSEIDATTEKGMEKSEKYEIFSVPTVIIFNDKNEIIGKYNDIEDIKKVINNDR